MRTIKMARAMFFILGLFLFQITFPQISSNKKIDSLLNILKKSKEDTSKVNTLNALSEQFWYVSKYEDARKYADSALQIAEKLNFIKGIGIAFSNIGIAYQRLGNLKEALQNHITSLKIFEKLEYKSKIAFTYTNLADIHDRQGNYPEAWKTCLAALKISEKIGDKEEMAAAYNSLGNINVTQHNNKEALNNYFTSLELSKELGNKRGIAIALLHIGNVYFIMNNDNDALAYTQASLEISKEIGEYHFLSVAYYNIGDYHRMKTNYSKALTYFLESLKIVQETGRIDGIAATDLAISQLYIDLKKPSEARKYLEEALILSRETGRKNFIAAAYQLLIESDLIQDSLEGRHDNTYARFKFFIPFRDSLLNEKITAQLAEMKVKYETEKKDKEITLLKNEKLTQSLALKRQKETKDYLIAGIVLFVILTFFLYINYRTREQLKLQTVRNKIASDLHDDVGATISGIRIFSQLAKERPGNNSEYIEKITTYSDDMLNKLGDIVWSINAENDSFAHMISRLRNYAQAMTTAKNIELEFQIDPVIEKKNLNITLRKNIYMITREAINNAVKYAECSSIRISLKPTASGAELIIADNGKGFDNNKVKAGNGLTNMQKRAEEMQNTLHVETKPGAGVSIRLFFNFT